VVKMTRKKEIEIEMGRLISKLSLIFLENQNLFLQIMGAGKNETENIAQNFDVLENIAENLKQSYVKAVQSVINLKKEYFELEESENETKNNK